MTARHGTILVRCPKNNLDHPPTSWITHPRDLPVISRAPAEDHRKPGGVTSTEAPSIAARPCGAHSRKEISNSTEAQFCLVKDSVIRTPASDHVLSQGTGVLSR